MYKFKWSEFASKDIVEWLCDSADVKTNGNRKKIKELLIKIFKNTGGPPVTKKRLSSKSCESIAKGLINDALLEAFSRKIPVNKFTNYYLIKQQNEAFQSEITIKNPVYINWCNIRELEKLPYISHEIAKRIISERQIRGFFVNLKNLSERVSGIGEYKSKKLIGLISFKSNPLFINRPSDVEDIIKYLVSSIDDSRENGLIKILEYTANRSEKNKNFNWFSFQDYNAYLPKFSNKCSWIGLIQGRDYYKWLCSIFDDVSKKIDIAMFHMAMPSKGHPTRILLEKLIKAKKNGSKVRVLLDCDREDDIYKSKIINKNAMEFLKKGKVQVRFDKKDQLLHSKFIIIDETITILGNHNWSAGSYFQYDDISLVIKSKSMSKELTKRFNKMWKSGMT